MFVRVFALSFIVAAASLVVALLYGGVEAVVLVAALGILEVSLSFDNAVVNAGVLQRMSEFWQRIFLTLGMVVAVFGMRLVFPLVVVGVGAHLDPIRALDLAMNPPAHGAPFFPDGTPSYETLLNDANPKIATFGGMFLLLLFLNFICTPREVTWLSWLERPLARIGRFSTFAIVIALIALVLTAGFLAPNTKADVVMVSGALGMATYFLVDGLGAHFENENHSGPSRAALLTGRAAFFGFIYLEVLDASFSFDGVIGAFAISADPIIIALGLGLIGAMFVRSITVYLVRKGTLSEYIYLEHGAHWAIGALAAVLLVSTGHHLNEMVTGLLGVGIIVAAYVSSLIHNRRHPATQIAESPIVGTPAADPATTGAPAEGARPADAPALAPEAADMSLRDEVDLSELDGEFALDRMTLRARALPRRDKLNTEAF
ncbi:putative membrane protein [Nocardia nova SH22a]|uniref:Putative membrane protein n=1 Tax=Nocardia nova SH22a TaxID=1415166 RepID=W5TAI3_9NOCA|nr:putative membrane protein [Nocardia nova SH22a]